MSTKTAKLDAFTLAYIECALWSSMDNSDDSGGSPLEDNYGINDISPDTLAQMVADCAFFQRDNADIIHELSEYKKELAGHDFWLTRERHGAGFWDGGWHEKIGKRLTEYSHNCGPFELYVGDDGKIYH